MRLSLAGRGFALALDQQQSSLEISRLGLAGQRESLLAADRAVRPAADRRVTREAASGTRPADQTPWSAPAINEVERRNLNPRLRPVPPDRRAASTSVSAPSASKTNSAFYFLNPSYDSDFYLGLSQPLLARVSASTVNRTGIEVARRTGEISRLEFEKDRHRHGAGGSSRPTGIFVYQREQPQGDRSGRCPSPTTCLQPNPRRVCESAPRPPIDIGPSRKATVADQRAGESSSPSTPSTSSERTCSSG